MRRVTPTSAAQRRLNRVRGRLHGTAVRPRVSIHRTNKHIFVQAIDDTAGRTLAAVSDVVVEKGTKSAKATSVGIALAKKLSEKNIAAASVDRGIRKYHGRIRAVAEALRQAGIAV